MQTLNFNCSFCNKLMAVGMNLLGRNVRCPHCKQVVQAPATANAPPKAAPTPAVQASPPPAPTFQAPPPPQEGQESIFGEAPSDDLFGGGPLPPPLPTAHAAPAASRLFQPSAATRPVDRPSTKPDAPWEGGNDLAFQTSEPRREEPLEDDDEDQPAAKTTASRTPLPSSGSGGGMFVWMLLLYALIATGIAAYLFYERTNATVEKENNAGDGKSPYLSIPDFFGQYNRAERKKVSKIDGMPAATLPLPDELKVALGDTLQVGDLEVTPLDVKYGEVNRTRVGGSRPPTIPKLYLFRICLKVKNTSEDVWFCPTDPAFARKKVDANRAQVPGAGVDPYTGLEVGNKFLLGGAFLWPDNDYEYEYIEGQEDDAKPLGPGEERIVCIPADMQINEVKKALTKAREDNLPITWRVQLRRGIDTLKDADGQEHDVSVTSVIGVKLTASDFQY